jgi:membrane dipeptidase
VDVTDDAAALLAGTPLVDGHNDLPWALRRLGEPAPDLVAGDDPRDLDARERFAPAEQPPPRATLDDVVAHLEHVRAVAGIDHIGIGGDFDGTDALPIGLEDVSCYPRLFDALLARRWSADDCAKLAGRNALRVLRAADDVSH